MELTLYRSSAETYRGHEGPVSVPADLAPVVAGVFGLDNRCMAARGGAMTPNPPSGGGSAAQLLTPPQVAEFYGLDTPNGYGASIGILEFNGGGAADGFQQSDIDAFFQGLQLPPPTPGPPGPEPRLAVITKDGSYNAWLPQDNEATMDIEVAGSVAPGANIAVYFVPWTVQGWIDGISTAVHDQVNAPTVLSISHGWAEFEPTFNDPDPELRSWSTLAMTLVSIFFAEAATMGMTVFASSGDYGSSDGFSGTLAHVNYPASDPNVLAVGGSAVLGIDGPAPREVPWVDSYGATGGGVSDMWPLPPWQQGAGVLPSANGNGRIGRGVPDIAGNLIAGLTYGIVFNGKIQPALVPAPPPRSTRRCLPSSTRTTPYSSSRSR